MSNAALGITVAQDGLHATLLKIEEDRKEVVFRVSSVSDGNPFEGEEGIGSEGALAETSVDFGGSGGGLQDELGETEGEDESGNEGWNFQNKLEDLIERAENAGVKDPAIGFALRPGDVKRQEVSFPREEELSSEKLSDLANAQSEEEIFEEERVEFLPMAREDGRRRVLALTSRENGPVFTTIRAIQDETLTRLPRTKLLSSEISLYFGLGRKAGGSEGNKNQVVLRVIDEKTLVLLVEDGQLKHVEELPVGSQSPPETLARRVLLLKDEEMVGDIDQVLVAERGKGDAIGDALEKHFEGAAIKMLRKMLPGPEIKASAASPEAQVSATAVAERLIDREEEVSLLQEKVNLLPDEYKPSSLRLPVGWPIAILMGLLVMTSVGFVWLYFSNVRAINQQERALSQVQRKIKKAEYESVDRLKTRIDSLKSAKSGFEKATSITNRLLQGSNKWSRQMEKVARKVDSIGGISIEKWQPVSRNMVEMRGETTRRPNVIRLTEELGGKLRILSSREVRDAKIFKFQIRAPLDTSKPKIAEYWRKKDEGESSIGGNRPGPGPTSTSESPFGSIAESDSTEKSGEPNAEATQSETSGQKVEDEKGQGQWTLVVASLKDSSRARRAARKFKSRDIEGAGQVRIWHEEGERWHKVGMGSYQSPEKAAEALQKMKRVPQGTWLYQHGGDN